MGKWVVEREKRHSGEENAVTKFEVFFFFFFRGVEDFCKDCICEEFVGKMGSVGSGLQQQLLPSAPLVGETMGDNTSSLGEALDPTSFSQQQLCTRRSGQVNKSLIPFFLPPPTTKPTSPCRKAFLIISLQPIFFQKLLCGSSL